MAEQEVRAALELEIRQAVADGFAVFISGMARGVDIWAAEIVLQLRNEVEGLRLVCASPYDGFERRWRQDWRDRYTTILQSADLVRFICKRYHPDCFQLRNEWMVDHSARVIAVWNGQPSGTKNTIDYAMQKGVNIVCANLSGIQVD